MKYFFSWRMTRSSPTKIQQKNNFYLKCPIASLVFQTAWKALWHNHKSDLSTEQNGLTSHEPSSWSGPGIDRVQCNRVDGRRHRHAVVVLLRVEAGYHDLAFWGRAGGDEFARVVDGDVADADGELVLEERAGHRVAQRVQQVQPTPVGAWRSKEGGIEKVTTVANSLSSRLVNETKIQQKSF